MVPDSSPRASKGVLALAWRLSSHFFARGPAFLGCILFRWVRASAPAGCSPRGLGGVVTLLRGLNTSLNASAGLVVPSCELAVARVHGRGPSSRAGMDDQGQTRLFTYAPTSPFRKEEGGSAPCYPRWAPNMVSPVSCKRVIRVDVRAPFVGGRLGAQRHAQKYLRVICRTRSPGDGVRGLDASLRWDSVTRSFPLVSEMS